jgi:two-component system, NtrC family, sensor histidine kinase HydH
VFEPFFTTRKAGTGLGLPNARKLVEAHGGTLTLESRVGEGTTATILLPMGM